MAFFEKEPENNNKLLSEDKVFKLLNEKQEDNYLEDNKIPNSKDFFANKTKHFLEPKFESNFISTSSFFIKKETDISESDDVLLFAIYVKEQNLTTLQKKIISSYKSVGFKVVTIIACSDINYYCGSDQTDSDIEIIRENRGYDFGSWTTAVNVLVDIGKANSISFTNDSICPINFSEKLLLELLKKIKKSNKNVVYLTRNEEIYSHNQSYFFCIKKSAINCGILDIFSFCPPLCSKDDLINEVEVGLPHLLEKQGFTIDTIYDYPQYKNNVTIKHWEKLLDDSFPFFKLKLFESNIIQIQNKSVLRRFNEEIRKDISEHIQKRGAFDEQITYKGEKNIESIEKINFPPTLYARPIQLDIKEEIKLDSKVEKFICILHAFYVDVGIEIINRLCSLKIPFRLIITTNTNEKKLSLLRFLNKNNILAEINIHENKGRDILPFINELKKIKETNLPILHLHTKKSPHEDALKNWGNDILNKLISNSKNVGSILKIFEDTDVGIIYPEFFDIIKDRINWGYNFGTAKFLLNKFKIDISLNDYLSFPAGSMMWLRLSAIKQLIDYEYEEKFFEEENGQEDGTSAHAIERIFFHVCKSNGYEYLPITSKFSKENYEEQNYLKMNIPSFQKVNQLIEYCKKYVSPEFKKNIKGFLKENHNSITYPVIFKNNKSKHSRLNILIPTLEPEKTYGGITTALKIFKEFVEKGEFLQVRCIVTTDKVSLKAVKSFSEFMNKSFAISKGNNSKEEKIDIILPLKTNSERVIDILENDIFIATAWWTADLGFRIIDAQKSFFNKYKKLIYIIQDYEPIFYPHGAMSAKTKSTYLNKTSTIAILNSEELYNFFKNNFEFHDSYYLPFELNHKLALEISQAKNNHELDRENWIICYGRPSTPRNCFESILDALEYWQTNDDHDHVKEWKIFFIGEDFSKDLIANIKNAKVLGKLSLTDYAKIMSKAKVGLSLMESPHPSYPPLEMAIFGVKVITNDYEPKNLSIRNENINNIEAISQNLIYKKLKILTRESSNNKPEISLKAPRCDGKVFDVESILNSQS